jgi:hypothetical protein
VSAQLSQPTDAFSVSNTTTGKGTASAVNGRRLLQNKGNGNGGTTTTTTTPTTVATCPSLTSDGTTLSGNGNGQYQNGKPGAQGASL